MYDRTVEPITDLQNFGATLRELKAYIKQPPPNAHALTAMLEEITATFRNIHFEHFDKPELRTAVPEILRSIFDLRLRLRSKLPAWHKGWKLSANGQRALREVLKITRYTTEMLGEFHIRFKRLNDGERTYQGFTGDKINTLLNPQFDTGRGLQFQAGDILLMRRCADNDAAIARIGGMDSQFSHLGVIYVDLRRRLHVVEATIEYGAVITPLEEVLNQGLVRASLLRHKETALARQAARIIHDRVTNSLRCEAQRIPYDFTMQLEGYEQLFSAKLARAAYDEASGGEIKLPTFVTRFSPKHRNFLNRIGVTAEVTFTPIDMEIEPQFDLVAEWRDFRTTAKARLQEIIMDRLFDWMEQYGYRFREDFTIKMMAGLGLRSGWLPTTVQQALQEVMPIVPANMNKRAVAAIAMLYYTGQVLLDEMLRLQVNHIDKTGLPLPPTKAAAALEKIREQSGNRIGYLVRD